MSGSSRRRYSDASLRLQSRDYSSAGSYFVTICTNRRVRYFGEVVDKQMQLSVIGEIAEKCWMEIPEHFPFVRLGAHVVMPDHVHGIVVIDWGGGGEGFVVVGTRLIASPPDMPMSPPSPKNKFGPQSRCTNHEDGSCDQNGRDAINRVPTDPNPVPTDPDPIHDGNIDHGGITGNHNPMLHENLPRVIRWFKGRVSFESHQINPAFKWQSRYYDHIIRDTAEYLRIEDYIQRNPTESEDGKWEEEGEVGL